MILTFGVIVYYYAKNSKKIRTLEERIDELNTWKKGTEFRMVEVDWNRNNIMEGRTNLNLLLDKLGYEIQHQEEKDILVKKSKK